MLKGRSTVAWKFESELNFQGDLFWIFRCDPLSRVNFVLKNKKYHKVEYVRPRVLT